VRRANQLFMFEPGKKKMMRFLLCILSTLILVAAVPATAAGATGHVGVKTCTKCHDVHGES